MSPRNYRPFSPRYTRRAAWHDYRSRSIYMITISKGAATPDLSIISGTPEAVKVQLTEAGEAIRKALGDLCGKYQELQLYRYAIMPDHVHMVLFVKTPTDYHLGTAIGYFKGCSSRRFWQLTGRESGPVFEDNFHDRILMNPGQLERMMDYVADNPRRRLIKSLYPDLFRRRLGLTLEGEKFEALGNIFLLRHPLITQVRVSSRFTQEQLVALDSQWSHIVEEGGVLVSPFISPAEKKYRDLALDNGGNVVIIEENGMGERYKPGGRLFDICAQGRLLIVAPMGFLRPAPPMTRAKALHLNDIAAAVAQGRFAVSFSPRR